MHNTFNTPICHKQTSSPYDHSSHTSPQKANRNLWEMEENDRSAMSGYQKPQSDFLIQQWEGTVDVPVHGADGMSGNQVLIPMTKDEAFLYRYLVEHSDIYQSLCQKLQASGLALPFTGAVLHQAERNDESAAYELDATHDGYGMPESSVTPFRSGETAARQRILANSESFQTPATLTQNSSFHAFLLNLDAVEQVTYRYFTQVPGKIMLLEDFREHLVKGGIPIQNRPDLGSMTDLVMALKAQFALHGKAWPFVELGGSLIFLPDEQERNRFRENLTVTSIRLPNGEMVGAMDVESDMQSTVKNAFSQVYACLFNNAGTQLSLKEISEQTGLREQEVFELIEAANERISQDAQDPQVFKKGHYGYRINLTEINYDYGNFKFDRDGMLQRTENHRGPALRSGS